MPLIDTPIEEYHISGVGLVHVKREDLCCPAPGPPFSKVRGILRGLTRLRDSGVEVVGYAETKVSMASWGITWVAKQIGGLRSIIYVPKYKDGVPPLLAAHMKRWESFGGETRFTKPNRGKIIHYRGAKELLKEFGLAAEMLTMGLPFMETKEETARQVSLLESGKYKSVVLCIGSGVVCSGVLNGFVKFDSAPPIIYGVSVKKLDNTDKKKRDIMSRAGLFHTGLLASEIKFKVVNTDYEYLEAEEIDTPFPCNPFYDRKAWAWLISNYNRLEKPVLFWNIGAGGIPEEL